MKHTQAAHVLPLTRSEMKSSATMRQGQISRRTLLAGGSLLALTLAGCGGGSGGDSGGGSAPAKTYSLKSAFDDYLGANHGYSAVADVNLGGHVTRNGTASETALAPETFNSDASASVFISSATADILGPYVTKYYFNDAKQLLGIDYTASLIPDFGLSVVTGTLHALPTSAKVGDSGSLGTTTTYVEANMESTLGTGEVTWSVTAGTTAGTVVLEILNTQAIPGADTANTVLKYEIDSNNVITLVRQAVEISVGSASYSGVLTLSAAPT